MSRAMRACGLGACLLVTVACADPNDTAEASVGAAEPTAPSGSNSVPGPSVATVPMASGTGSMSAGLGQGGANGGLPLAPGGAPGSGGSAAGPGGAAGVGVTVAAAGGAAGIGGTLSAMAGAGGFAGTPSAAGGDTSAGGSAGVGGASVGGSAGLGGTAGSSSAGGAFASAGGSAGAPDYSSVADELNSSSGFKLEAPCGAINSSQRSCDHEPREGCGSGLSTFLRTDKTLGGDPGTFYDVTLRFRGIVEANQYEGGTSDHNGFYTGGQVSNANGLDGGEQYNQYLLEVASPQAIYHLNNVDQDQRDTYRQGLANSSGVHHFGFILDYRATIRVEGGTTVSLYALDNDCLFGRNCEPPSDDFGHCDFQTFPDLPDIQQPFDGNFIWIDVEDVSVVP